MYTKVNGLLTEIYVCDYVIIYAKFLEWSCYFLPNLFGLILHRWDVGIAGVN